MACIVLCSELLIYNMKLHENVLIMQSLLIVITGVYGIEKQKLVFSTSKYLKEFDFDTGVVQTLTTQNDLVYSLAYDDKERFIYFPRYYYGDIVRFSYPTNHTVMLETIVITTHPFGIAFDSVNRHLYWTARGSNKIKRCNSDGTNEIVILNEPEPTVLTLDIQNRWIYFGQERIPNKIYRTNFDGMDKRVIIKNIPANVYGIGLDVSVERIYWMEYQTGDLRSACYNGSAVNTIISTNITSQNWGITLDDDFIFYTSNNKIRQMSKSLQQNPTVVHADTQDIRGLLFYKQEDESFSERTVSHLTFIKCVMTLKNDWNKEEMSYRLNFSPCRNMLVITENFSETKAFRANLTITYTMTI